MLRVLIDNDFEACEEFLIANKFPTKLGWNQDTLRDYSLCLFSVVNDGQTIGYVWCNRPLGLEPEVLEAHYCITERYHRKWITPRVLHELITAFRLLGANWLMARPTTVEHEHLCLRHGFKFYGDYMLLDIR